VLMRRICVRYEDGRRVCFVPEAREKFFSRDDVHRVVGFLHGVRRPSNGVRRWRNSPARRGFLARDPTTPVPSDNGSHAQDAPLGGPGGREGPWPGRIATRRRGRPLPPRGRRRPRGGHLGDIELAVLKGEIVIGCAAAEEREAPRGPSPHGPRNQVTRSGAHVLTADRPAGGSEREVGERSSADTRPALRRPRRR
jgi:hypothetical protein